MWLSTKWCMQALTPMEMEKKDYLESGKGEGELPGGGRTWVEPLKTYSLGRREWALPGSNAKWKLKALCSKFLYFKAVTAEH